MRKQITLYGDDAERFKKAQERIGNERPGSEPCNAEAVRTLLDMAGY
ncbi:hypothetical protein [Haloarcula argentinensis]|nr:hypothetical protein [Haloarcula argentinensis]